MKITQRAALTATAVAGLVGSALVLAPAAGAAETATAVPAAVKGATAAYNGVCGAGYTVVNSATIGTPQALGTVYLTYNPATGNNCVVTVRNAPGGRVHMTAEISITATGERARESGMFTSYAGPVYLHAAGYCVNWYGEISGVSAGKIGTNCSSLAS